MYYEQLEFIKKKMSAEKLPLTVLLEVHVSRAKACCKAMSRFLLQLQGEKERFMIDTFFKNYI